MTDRPEAGPEGGAWHAATPEATLAALGATPRGLSEAEAAARLARFGPNRLPAAPGRSPWRRLLDQFRSLLVVVLLVAGVLALAFGKPVDAAVILLVVLVNAAIGFIQEGKAEEALSAIARMLDPRAAVRREGHRRSIPAEQVVPGDILLLEPGDRVPADARLLRAHGLAVDESALTGESVPAEKSAAPVPPGAPLAERASMLFSGTLVVRGTAIAVATATGAGTELGRISRLLTEVEAPTTPLLRQMDRFARQATAVVLALSVVVFAFAVLARGYSLPDGFLALVAIAVSAIPAGLPAVLTVTLAIGVRRMAARNALIRRLPAVETLGAVSVICSDKTGTLTRNEMSVARVASAGAEVRVEGEGYAPQGRVEPGLDAEHLAAAARVAALCNDAALRRAEGGWTAEGDPMEAALLAFAHRAGLDAEAAREAHPRLDAIPFDSAHRWMATLHGTPDGGRFACVKGAPEAVLPMAGAAGEALQPMVARLAAEGMRVLALAEAVLPEGADRLDAAALAGALCRPVLVGLIDPPRPEAIAAVAECRAAGIRVVMITGDHAATAAAIARDLGLAEAPRVLTGAELDALDDAAFRQAARDVEVFARTSPEHKLRLVEALQADGRIVAMTGDGVNDSPALKRADIGVAMGRGGTVAAQQAADMVLADDNFASIVAAVKEGRTVHDNVTKVIGWTLPTNGGEAFAIIAAIVAAVVLPLTPLQILWVNMITAVTLGLVLAFEPPEEGVMRRPPRAPDAPLVDGHLLWRILFVSALFVAGTFGVFFWFVGQGAAEAVARSAAVNALVALEVFYLFSVRMLHGRSLGWRQAMGTPPVLAGLAVVLAAQALLTYAPPLQAAFGTAALSAAEVLACAAVGAAAFLVLEAEKALLRRLRRR
ncbi:MAG: HAD-IC family P-type ATPase [Acetobacteraceae bacterium]|nr:HAD-IC family P-type ATPase [Acetobacteraceae bacterium]